MTGFSAELELAERAGVSHPDNLPFLFNPEQPNGKALLLIHGFGASPYEMRPLGKYLHERGYLILGTRLAGHGTRPEDLRTCGYRDWQASVERSFASLKEAGLPISLIGQSTGALLGLSLALKSELKTLVLLSPFLRLAHPLSEFTWLLKYLIPYQQRLLPDPEKQHYYSRRPLAGIAQIVKLRNEVKLGLSRIKPSTLVMASEGDQTVAPGTGQSLFEKLGCQSKEFKLFGPEIPHVLSTPENPEFSKVCHMIETYLDDYMT